MEQCKKPLDSKIFSPITHFPSFLIRERRPRLQTRNIHFRKSYFGVKLEFSQCKCEIKNTPAYAV